MALIEYNISFCALSETKVKRSTPAGNYVLLYSGVEKCVRAYAGARILLHRRL